MCSKRIMRWKNRKRSGDLENIFRYFTSVYKNFQKDRMDENEEKKIEKKQHKTEGMRLSPQADV